MTPLRVQAGGPGKRAAQSGHGFAGIDTPGTRHSGTGPVYEHVYVAVTATYGAAASKSSGTPTQNAVKLVKSVGGPGLVGAVSVPTDAHKPPRPNPTKSTTVPGHSTASRGDTHFQHVSRSGSDGTQSPACMNTSVKGDTMLVTTHAHLPAVPGASAARYGLRATGVS